MSMMNENLKNMYLNGQENKDFAICTLAECEKSLRSFYESIDDDQKRSKINKILQKKKNERERLFLSCKSYDVLKKLKSFFVCVCHQANKHI